MRQLLPQRCPTAALYLTWALYPSVLAYAALRGAWVAAAVWALAWPLALWAYVRIFPRVSHHLGYGRVDDVSARSPGRSDVRVTLYSFLGCPFCPIVERRVRELQAEMGFELVHVDVTVRPGLARANGIRSVPVVEAGGRRLVGHATRRELADLVDAAESPGA